MKLCMVVMVCAVMGLAAPVMAGPTRVPRANDESDNSIDIDSSDLGDNPTSNLVTNSSETANSILDADSTLYPNADASSPTDANPAITLPPLPTDTLAVRDQDTTGVKEVQTEDEDEFEQDFDEEMQSPSTNQGSNVFSLLNLVGQLFPGSSGSNVRVRRLFNNFIHGNERAISSLESYINNNLIRPRRRQDKENEIEIDEYDSDISSEEESSEESSEGVVEPDIPKNKPKDKPQSVQPDKPKEDKIKESDENTAAEESVENGLSEKQSSEDNGSENSGSDYEEEPPGGGDGAGGGVLGLIAGLSGGEDGQSDLGSLLAAVSGIVVNLSGDGVDLNSLIAGGLGLFVGLLSEGMENPGSVVASYLATSLDTLSGGGSKNNGAFFGNFVSRLLKGISATPEESGAGGGSDSAGFLVSLLAGLSGSSSGGSSGGGDMI